MSAKLGNQLRHAVYGVDEFKGEVRKPEIASYLWCPNCTAPVEEHDGRERMLVCTQCALKLHVLAHEELAELRENHLFLKERGELFLNSENE